MPEQKRSKDNKAIMRIYIQCVYKKHIYIQVHFNKSAFIYKSGIRVTTHHYFAIFQVVQAYKTSF